MKRYLEAEIEFVQQIIRSSDMVLELGCGYGRVTRRLAHVGPTVTGIDTARQSLSLARELAESGERCFYISLMQRSWVFMMKPLIMLFAFKTESVRSGSTRNS